MDSASLGLTALRAQRGLRSFASELTGDSSSSSNTNMRMPEINLPDMPKLPQLQMPKNFGRDAAKGWGEFKSAAVEAFTPVSEQPPQLLRANSTQGPTRDRRKSIAQTGEATSLWSSIQNAVSTGAGSLRSKMAGEALCESDEEGFRGGQTHLCRIMKEYYVQKVNTPAELPAWLFSARERSAQRAWDQPPTPTGQSSARTEYGFPVAPQLAPQPQRTAYGMPIAPQLPGSGPSAPQQQQQQQQSTSSFSDIFDSVEQDSKRQRSIDSGYSTHSNASSAYNSGPSKATDRLRAMGGPRGNTGEPDYFQAVGGGGARPTPHRSNTTGSQTPRGGGNSWL